MLNVKHYPHIDSGELFPLCQERCGEDIEGIFNELYCPRDSVMFWIPDEDALEDEIEDEPWKAVMIEILLENGFHYGDSLYIDCDY